MAGGEPDLPRFGETLPQSRETPEAEGLAPPSSEDKRGLRVPGPLGGEAAPRAVLPRAADGSGRGHVLFRGADRERRVSAARCKQRVRWPGAPRYAPRCPRRRARGSERPSVGHRSDPSRRWSLATGPRGATSDPQQQACDRGRSGHQRAASISLTFLTAQKKLRVIADGPNCGLPTTSLVARDDVLMMALNSKVNLK